MLSVSAELARRVLDAAPDAVIIIDVSGQVRYADRQICTLFGYTRARPHNRRMSTHRGMCGTAVLTLESLTHVSII
jgi:PAS domain S-box-containing protein